MKADTSDTTARVDAASALDAAIPEWFKLDRLPIFMIVNIAHGLNPWHPTPLGFAKDAQMQRLVVAVRAGTLAPADLADRAKPTIFTQVTLGALAAYAAQGTDPAFKALLDCVIGPWRAVRSRLPPEQAASTEADPYRTGAPGRPTIMHLVEQEFERRAAGGEARLKVSVEARELSAWAKRVHPEARTPTPKTIENNLRQRHRKWLKSRPPK